VWPLKATGIAFKDLELVVDARHLAGNCLRYDLEAAVENDPHVLEVLGAPEGGEVRVQAWGDDGGAVR